LKVTAKLSVILAVIFAVICFAVAITGFSSLGNIADPVQRADGRGFAWFWTFLGIIAAAIGALGVWIVKTHKDSEDA
jgi:ABC-type multidrug transport system permease subunit